MNFDRSIAWTMRWEGGYVDHPRDPGGATNRGITQATLDEWRATRGLMSCPVRDLSESETLEIYRARYWAPLGCDDLAWPLCLAVLDFGVHSGAAMAARSLQRVTGARVDGIVGIETRSHAAALDPRETARALTVERRAFLERVLHARPELEVFRRGWMRRLDAMRREIDDRRREDAAT